MIPSLLSSEVSQESHRTGASVSSLRVRIWNFSFETNTGSGFPFLFYIYKAKLQPLQAELLSIPQPTRILTGLCFVLGWGAAVAAQIKSRRCDMLQKRDELPGAVGMGKPGILIETAAEEASSLLYSFEHLYTTELSALAALLKTENGFPIHSELYIGSN